MPITITETKSPLEHTSFAVRLPASIFQAFDEPNVNPVMAAILQDTGVVGTITVMRKSVMIWFGWGKLESSSQGQASNAASAVESASGNPPMGPLIVAMPRTKYQGAFSSDREASSTRLVGGLYEDEELLCRQMASRLSSKLGVSTFVSCSLAGTPGPASQGIDQTMIQQRAAALAEKEVYKLLKDKEL